ncbi:MAG: hypothetical protein O3A18_02775 [Planctomycetota bacterium]|jgi:hypothetical protein|nr:hypothetical protein [Planctomycetota bacterium]
MTPPPALADDPRAALRCGVYLVLIAVAAGGITGRLLAVNSVDLVRLEQRLNAEADHAAGDSEPHLRTLQRPFLSGNDRSRWCTVRALVEHGTYAIDEIVVQPNWDTIDMVKHDGRGNPAPGPDDGHLYSSKPPLLATLMAGEYWLLNRLTGWTLGSHPYELGRILLFTWNVLPFVGYLLILAGIVERYGSTDFGRLFVVAAAAFGTLVTSYAVAFTNHWPAACAAMLALDAALRIVVDGERRPRWFLIAGTAAALMAACELPAISFALCLLALLGWKSPALTLRAAAPGLAVVAAAAVGTNYLAHGTLQPAYAQRHVEGGWYDYQFRRGDHVIDSYWKPTTPKSEIDQGEPSRAAYAFHVLVGHHGIFSLTPVWLLSLAGLAMLLRKPIAPGDPALTGSRAIAAAILACTVICLAFYIARPLEDRNYGGMATGFRWAIWFAPLWLWAMLPAADALATTPRRRLLAAVLLAASVMTASFPTWNPWTQPWLQVFWDFLA